MYVGNVGIIIIVYCTNIAVVYQTAAADIARL